MKVNDILNEGRTVDLRDPDHAPGAAEREGAARASAKDTAEIAAKNLSALAAKYKLGHAWTVDKEGHIKSDRKTPNDVKKLKTSSGLLLDVTMWVAGNYNDLCFTFNGVDLSSEDKKAVMAKAKVLMPKMYDHNMALRSDDRKSFQSVTLHLGHPSAFADAKTFAGLKKLLDHLKKEVKFTSGL